ncbi:putative disease resistance protein At5g47280 [Nymphaea colorata]|nr:putative disease resistance protein At5g47280 [Nymphaea colorata]
MADLIGGALVGAVVAELLKAVLEARDNVSEFGEHFQRLKATLTSLRYSIQQVEQIDEELRDGKQIDDAQTVKMKNRMSELREQLEYGQMLIKKCSKVRKWNLWKKYKYSKKLIKLDTEFRTFLDVEVQSNLWVETKRSRIDMKELLRRFSSISTSSSVQDDIPYCSYAMPEVPSKIVGLRAALEELKRRLFSQDVVGVCAPGGCGKTTLVAKLCQDEAVKGKFGEIVFLTVSESPNLMVIYQRLWARLVNPNSVPKFIDEDDAYTQLMFNLNKRKRHPVLVVLDDVWSEVVLEKLLFEIAGIKTLVTSRIKFKLLKSIYTLPLLGQKDALDLFCHLAIDSDQAIDKPDDDMVKQIVAGCKGLPLALKVIGSSLRRESLRKWRKTAQMLLKGGQIFKEHKALLNILGTSLISLEKDLKECFMDLGSFPEDEKIPAASVVDMWIEIRGFDEDDAYVALVELSRRNLFTLIERTQDAAGHIDGSFSNLFILQHDLLRELAIYTNQGNDDNNAQQNVMLFLKQVDLPKMQQQTSLARIVSIQTGEMGPWNWFDMALPHAEVLILNFTANSYCLPPFLERMENLKVLIIANHSSNPAALSGLSTFGSLKNLRRIRLQKILVPLLSTFTEPLQYLQKLSLVLCEVSQDGGYLPLDIPRVFPAVTELEVDYCKGLDALPPGICNLSNLKRLSITNCPDLNGLPESIGSLTGLEALRLHACTSLEGLPDSVCKLASLRILDVSHCSNIEDLPIGIGELHRLERLDMSWCLSVRELPASVRQMISLRTVVCDDEIFRLWTTVGHNLSKLRVEVAKEDINLRFLY